MRDEKKVAEWKGVKNMKWIEFECDEEIIKKEEKNMKKNLKWLIRLVENQDEK